MTPPPARDTGPAATAGCTGTGNTPAPAPARDPLDDAGAHGEAVVDVAFELNGRPVQHRCPPTRRLLSLLREDFGLTGAKPGCEVGRCGACVVWLDDAPVNACLVMAWQLRGRRVETIESVGRDERSAPVREALARGGALQCGYCTPGFVMTLTHLHRCRPRPDAQEAEALACGHLCRCTGYAGIRRAIERLF